MPRAPITFPAAANVTYSPLNSLANDDDSVDGELLWEGGEYGLDIWPVSTEGPDPDGEAAAATAAWERGDVLIDEAHNAVVPGALTDELVQEAARRAFGQLAGTDAGALRFS